MLLKPDCIIKTTNYLGIKILYLGIVLLFRQSRQLLAKEEEESRVISDTFEGLLIASIGLN
jgi:hypothetical protein